ncbi:hypothetical protein G4B84_010072, partial [Aspergillus flavus NRRL3357]
YTIKMLIAVVPASPKTGQAAIRALLNSTQTTTPITVKGVYRDLSRVPEEFLSNPHFQASKGDVSDATSLDLTGVDAVLAITPPRYDGSDFLACARTASENTRLAIQKSGSVKRLVLLSSMGAEHESGTGEIMTNHIAETILKDAAPEVVICRCAYFMENWAMGVQTAKSEQPHLYSYITPADFEVPMVCFLSLYVQHEILMLINPLNQVAVKDMGQAFATYLLKPDIPERPHIVDVHGPRSYTPKDVQKAFEEAVGKEVELRLVERKDLSQFFAGFLPKNVAEAFTEMTDAFLPGGIMAPANAENSSSDRVWRGKTELREAIRELCEGSGVNGISPGLRVPFNDFLDDIFDFEAMAAAAKGKQPTKPLAWIDVDHPPEKDYDPEPVAGCFNTNRAALLEKAIDKFRHLSTSDRATVRFLDEDRRSRN